MVVMKVKVLVTLSFLSAGSLIGLIAFGAAPTTEVLIFMLVVGFLFIGMGLGILAGVIIDLAPRALRTKIVR